jgi:hypothetical protein
MVQLSLWPSEARNSAQRKELDPVPMADPGRARVWVHPWGCRAPCRAFLSDKGAHRRALCDHSPQYSTAGLSIKGYATKMRQTVPCVWR